MPKQGLEVLPIAGYDVSIYFKTKKTLRLPHAQIKHTDGIVHVGLIRQSDPGSYPFVCSTIEFKTADIRRITYRPLPEDSVLTLYI